MGIDTAELIRRARVIVIYSGKAQADLAEEAGLSRAAPKGWFDASKPNSYPSVEALVLLADAAGIPPRFAERGFADLVEDYGAEIAKLQRQVNELEIAIQVKRADIFLEVAEQIELQKSELSGRLGELTLELQGFRRELLVLEREVSKRNDADDPPIDQSL